MKALVALVALLAPLHADARCAPRSLRAAVVTPAQTQIPKGGGIVVAAEKFFDDGRTPNKDVTKQWKLAGGTIEVIAPGLVVYRSDTSLELKGPKPSVKFTATTTEPPKLDAPKVQAILATKTSAGRKSSTQVEVTLDGAVPAGAVAIVAVDAKGKPMSFGRVANGKLYVFEQQRCEIHPDGTVEPKYGDTITVFWVDAIGRKSPASKPVKLDGAATAVDGDE